VPGRERSPSARGETLIRIARFLMMRFTSALALLLCGAAVALPCSLCPGLQNAAPFRQELTQSKLVLYGTLANPKLGPGGVGGSVDLHIDSVLKHDPFLGNQKVVQLNRYVPLDPKSPPKYLVFCDVFNGKLDPYRALPLKSPAAVDYLRGAAALDAKDRGGALHYFFRYLDSPDADVAADAYLEFARATDAEVGNVARKLDPEKLRRLINDAATPPERIGLFAFLLGACGTEREAAFLRALVEKPTEKTARAQDGILAGYTQMRPRDGWALGLKILQDSKRPFTEREAVLRSMRFFHGWKGDEYRREILEGMRLLLPQGDIADLAVEDLRKWGWWDLTPNVLALYGKESHKAPILQRGLVRYALSCPQPAATEFIARVRQQDPATVKDIEEALQFEKKK